MRVLPFRGIRYNRQKVDPAPLAAPPYDQIGPAERDALHRAAPYQFAHLSVPVAVDGSAHEHCADLHRQWLEEGVLIEDERPALYPVSIELPSGAIRLGLCALVGVEPAEGGLIQPHEQTVTKTVEERLGLLRTTGVDLEPILLMSDDGGALERLLADDTGDGRAVVEHRDEFGNLHRLFKIDEPARLAAYRETLAGRRGPIADGHHRYQVARLYSEETGAADGPAAAKLAVITSLASGSLTIDPIHRGFLEAPDLEAAARHAVERRLWQGGSGTTLAAAVAKAAQPAMAVWRHGASPEIWSLDPASCPGELPAAASQLTVVLLHASLFPLMGLEPEAATDGTVAYRSDPDVLFQSVEAGELELGIWLPPMEPATFAAAIAGGDLLPPKSTRFLPKVVSGLVWSRH